MQQAAQAFRAFSDEDAKLSRVKLDKPPKALYKLGELEAVIYRTNRNRRKETYKHNFSKSARPVLAANSDGSTLHILGGEYVITEKGIEG